MVPVPVKRRTTTKYSGIRMAFTMSAEFQQRVRDLFGEALDRPEVERQSFLETACSGDPEALEAVSRLLQAYATAPGFFEEHSPRLRRIGRYAVTGELGRGAMGIVCDAIDPLICRKVAIKVIQFQPVPDSNNTQFMRDRLLREARSAGGLSHSGIVTVFDVGEDGNTAFIAMERVDGPSLQETLNSGRKLGFDEVLDILRQTAEALDYAHGRGVVHRDVKPANIMLHEGRTVRISDFGIAKLTDTQHQTLDRLMMGTPSYMSPEQIETPQQVDGRSDEFSLAVIAFELLSGIMPFQGESLSSMAHQVVYGPRPSARAANPALPVVVDEVLCRALAKLPAERYANCLEFVGALEEATKSVWAPTFGQEKSPTGRQIGSPWTAPLRYSLIAAAAVVLLVSIFLLYHHVRPSLDQSQQKELDESQQKKRAAPPLVQFTANPQSIRAGASATLRWAVSGATEVSIDPGVGRVPVKFAREIRPLVPTTYVLTAAGTGGRTSAKVFVNVTRNVPGAKDLYDEAVAKRQADQIRQALPLFQKAAELGEPHAMVELGEIFMGG